ncbi:MAG: LLM class flavin-dependent oxidoreductase [Acidiferrobacterales bacterium]
MSKPLRFGVRLNIQGEMGADSSAFTYALEMARMAESLGYDSIWIPDHVENAHLHREKPILEHWTTLTALGALTSRVRLGGHALNNNFRHPGLTAKIACTLDDVTGGRVILAPGSGWFEAEAKAYGFLWDDREGRHERLKESLTIMKKLFTEPEVTYHGKYFRLEGAYCNPKPVQQPHPPFWIAGEGSLTQELVEEFADCWFMYSKPPARVAELVAPMRQRAGRPLDVALSGVCLTGKTTAETHKWAQMYAAERKHRFTVPPSAEDVLQSNLVGDASAMSERVDQWKEAGADYIVIQPMPPMEGTRFFGEQVLSRYL